MTSPPSVKSGKNSGTGTEWRRQEDNAAPCVWDRGLDLITEKGH